MMNTSMNDEVIGILIRDNHYWDDLTFTITTSSPFNYELKAMEKSNINPGEVLFRFNSLYDKITELHNINTIDDEDYDWLWNTLNEKWKLMENNGHYGIYLIDPRFGNGLDYDDVKKGETWLEEKAGDDWNEFKDIYDSFGGREKPFDGDEWKLNIDDDPIKPFKRLQRTKDYSKYSDFCMKWLQVNGHCVKLETSFKVVRVVHNQWRRSLKDSLLNILVCDYYNIRALEQYYGRKLI